MGQRGRENRDLAEQRSARTRLSLRLIFPQVTRCFCFAPQKKSNETRLYASPYGKGRWCVAPERIRKPDFDKINRSADMNPQKGRHLLCPFCPCEIRKQGETSRRRERKETGSQPHGAPPVSVLYKSFRRLSLNFFAKKFNETEMYGEVSRSDGGDKKVMDKTGRVAASAFYNEARAGETPARAK